MEEAMRSEFIVLEGDKHVVHSDVCKCSKRFRDSYCAYGFTKDAIIENMNPFNEKMDIVFAPCAERKLKTFL